MGSYTTVPTGSPIQPSIISARTFTITGNVQLFWPTTFYNTLDVVAGFMAVTANASSNLILPDVSLVSTGTVILIANVGTNAFNVYNSNMTLITNITPGTEMLPMGQLYYLSLLNNTDPASGSSWYVGLIGGTGTSGATAAALQGYGLSVLPYAPTKLNTNFPISGQSTNYPVEYTDLASAIIMTGGANTVILPLSTAANIGNGFYVAVNNQGTGVVTVQTVSPDILDGGSNFLLDPGTNAWFACDGAGHYFSFGFSEIQLATVTWPNGSVSAPALRFTSDTGTGMYLVSSGSHTLGFASNGIATLNISPTAVLPQIPIVGYVGSLASPTYQFTGVLANSGLWANNSGITISFNNENIATFNNNGVATIPGTLTNPGYYFYNLDNYGLWATTGQLNLSLAGVAVIALTPSALSTPLQILAPPSGSVPGYSFTGSTGSGMGYFGSVVYFDVSGVQVFNIQTSALTMNTQILAPLNSSSPSYSFTGSITSGIGWDGSNINLRIAGSSKININNANMTSFVPILAPTGSSTTPPYSYQSYSNTGTYYNTGTSTINTTIAGADYLAIGASITTLNNSLSFPVAGTGLVLNTTNTNSRMGFVTLSAGTSGVISNASITSNTVPFVSSFTSSGTQLGRLNGFTDGPAQTLTIVSQAPDGTIQTNDNSTVAWLLIEGG